MPDQLAYLHFDYEPNEMTEYLYSQNLKLASRVETLSDLVAYMLQQQEYKSKDIDKLIAEVDQHFYSDSLAADEMLERSWCDRFKSELGSVPGVKL